MANLNLITRTAERAKKARVGRGGKRGKTAGRGTKGQSARAGNKKRPELRDIIKKLPKRRGYGKNRARSVVNSRPQSVAISLGRLDALFAAGAEVTSAALYDLGVIGGRGSSRPSVKIVSGGLSAQAGKLAKKLTVKGVSVSAAARATIEQAGGSVLE